MPEGHGHFEPNPVRVSWLGKGVEKHPPSPVRAGPPSQACRKHTAGLRWATSTEHLGQSSCVALGDRAGHQVDLVPFVTEEDSVTFSIAG